VVPPPLCGGRAAALSELTACAWNGPVLGVLVAAEWRQRWRSLVAVAVLIGIAGAVVLAGVAGARRTASAIDRRAAADRLADAHLQVSESTPALTRQVAALPAVETIEEVLLFVGSSGGELDLGVIAPRGDGYGVQVDRPRVTAGRLPAPGSTDEVALTATAARDAGVDIGDVLVLETFTQKQLETIDEAGFDGFGGPALRLTVVGIYETIENLLFARDDATGVASPAFAREHEASVGRYSGLFAIRLAPGWDVAAFEREVRAIYPPDEELSVERAAQRLDAGRGTTRVLAIGLGLFAAVAGLAALVVLAIVLHRQVVAGADGSDALRALGLDRRGLTLASWLPLAPAFAGGAVLAVGGAVALSRFFPIGIARQAEPSPGFDADWAVLALGGVALAGLSALVAWLVARRTGRPGAVRGQVTADVGVSGRLAGLGLGSASLVGARMAMGRGGEARPSRTGVVGAATAAVALAAALVFGASLDRLVDTPIRWGWGADVHLDAASDEVAPMAEALAADPAVAGVATAAFAVVALEGQQLQGTGLQPVKGDVGFVLLDGRQPTTPTEVVLGAATMRRLGVGLGDTVRGGDGDVRLTVVGRGVFAEIDGNAHDDAAGLTLDGLDSIRRSDGFQRVWVRLADRVDKDAAIASLSARYEGAISFYGMPRPPYDVQNLAEIDSLPPLLGLFVAALGLAAVAHAVVVGSRRRARDLAILRTIGFVPGQVRSSVLWQARTLTAVGIAVGIPLGLIAGQWAWTVLARQLGLADDAVISPWIAVLIPGAFVVAHLVAWPPAIAAARRRPAEVLRTE
jgi:hypothetical protein